MGDFQVEAGVVKQSFGLKENPGLKQNIKRFCKQKYLQAMVIPGIIWMIIFCYLPIYGIIFAFKRYNLVQPFWEAPWVGFEHFIYFIKDEDFFIVLKNTLGISFYKILIGFPLPIIFALLLNEIYLHRFKRFVQTVTYLPHFLSWVILGGLLITWLSETGLITEILLNIGIIDEPVAFLSEPKYFWSIAVLSDVWKELGWNSIIYLAAIAGIDPELYEAATIDGAGRLQKMWMITLPCIKGTIAVLFILTVSHLLNTNFDQILVLVNQVNLEASNVIDYYVYKMGIQEARYSYATAIGLMKSVVALMLLITANLVVKKLTGSSLY